MRDDLHSKIRSLLPPTRAHLLAGAPAFTRAASQVPGVLRVALIGSLATSKPEPKDIDLLVTVADDADLTLLAAHGRKLLGHCQSRNLGGEVFLASPGGAYLGRTCPWKDCRAGVRMSCDVLHCGQRPYLHDDLGTIRLSNTLVAEPPITLWPQIAAHVPVPGDVETLLLAPLRAEQAKPAAQPRRLGRQPPRYRFLLNPFRNRRYAICPNCDQRTLLRKVPLVIHTDPRNPVAIHMSCRYCPPCDLLIAHQDEVEAELRRVFPERESELVGKGYLVLGTLDRAIWKRGVAEPLAIQEMVEQLHDFIEVLELRRTGA